MSLVLIGMYALQNASITVYKDVLFMHDYIGKCIHSYIDLFHYSLVKHLVNIDLKSSLYFNLTVDSKRTLDNWYLKIFNQIL